MNKLLIVILITPLLLARIIQVTNANVHLVVRSVGRLPLLLHHPECPHSQQYHQKYLKIDTQDTIGIADCSKDKQLCQYLNVTHFPSLLAVTNSLIESIDSHQYLLSHGVATKDDEQSLLQSILALLKDEEAWVAIVLEEEHLPAVDKVPQNSEKRVIYVPNPSRLYDALKGMVGSQIGCWILVNTNKSEPFNRYYCGNGYKSDDLEKHLSHFKNGKMERYIFSRQNDPNKKYIESSILQQIVSDVGRKQQSQCKFIYFLSEHCNHCRKGDLDVLRQVIKGKRSFSRHSIEIFDMDREQYPRGLKIDRLPYLIQLCKGEMKTLEGQFTYRDLNNFLAGKQSIEKNEKSPGSEQL